MSTQVQWIAPPPLWQELSSATDPSPFRSPSILRFATDTFMQDLQNVLKNAPQTLRNYIAQGENWRNPGAGLDYTAPTPLPLKLYQPVHARFYVISSSLTCRKPGLPDHTVNKTAGETVAFVVRQIRPNAGFTNADLSAFNAAACTEYAWIPASAGSGSSTASLSASNLQAGWQQASGPDLLPGEEQISLAFAQTGSNGTSRRVYLGLIPASRRQQYISAPTLPPPSSSSGSSADGSSSSSSSSSGSSGSSGSSTSNGNGTPSDPRMDIFFRTVVAPWHNLNDWWNHLDATTPGSQLATDNESSSQIASALILYDFATFLSQNVADVWSAITSGAAVSTLSSAELSLYNTLGPALRPALAAAYQFGPQFESMGPADGLPSGYTAYALTDPANGVKPHTLLAPVTAALPPLNSVNAQVLPPIAQKPSNAQGNYWFIVRCVYLRPQCRCSLVSAPSQPFQLASYFDSDAPARRIQVALPIDTSAAALRKYDKGVAFLISDELRNQMSRVASLNDLSNGNIGAAGGVSIGWICSFSIPIITICALILLLIIVIALNIVFFWIPFFRICLPVPGLKGKS